MQYTLLYGITLQNSIGTPLVTYIFFLMLDHTKLSFKCVVLLLCSIPHTFSAMSFFNLALVTDSRYPSGISYHTCLFDDDTSDPLLPVIPETLQPRTCLSPSPVILGNTVGGFHRETQLTTSNIIGLLER